MKNLKIKSKNKASRKALLVFIIFFAVCFAAGFLSGVLMSETDFDGFIDSLKTGAGFFGKSIAPWLMIALAAALPLVCMPMHIRARRKIADWDGENEIEYEKIEKSLNVTLWIADSAAILMFFLMAAFYSGYSITQDFDDDILFLAACAAAMIILAEGIVFSQITVNLAAKINPEKDVVPVYDMKFHKKWMENCDEAEKIMVGKCAFKAFRAVSIVCAILASLLAIAALIFDIGFLPSLAVCLVWFVCQSVYSRESIKLSKSGSKLM